MKTTTTTTTTNATAKTINAAKRIANKGLLTAESTLSNRCKLIYQFRDADGVADYLKVLRMSATELKNVNPADIIKYWKCQSEDGTALVAKTFYKENEDGTALVDDNGKRVIDYQVFESKTRWTFKNVLDLLDYSQRAKDKRPAVTVRKIGVKYDIVNGIYTERVESIEDVAGVAE